MDVSKAVGTMLAVREYQDKPIAAESVQRILNAGRLTGSARNMQHWDFVVVQEKSRLQELGLLATSGRYIAKAAMAVAVVVPNAPLGYIDGARAGQDMMLVAWGDGVGSNWVTGVNIPEIKKLLHVPEDRMIVAVISFGYPAESVGAGKKNRKALSEVAHAEQFGVPFEV